MGVPTVFIVGTDRLPLVPEFLNLGSVVVVAPDHDTLRHWTSEHDQASDRDLIDAETVLDLGGTVVDLTGRRIVTDGSPLPLSDLEFKVLCSLLSPPGRALSFRELRRSGWGDGPDLPCDPYSVRALVQRLRAKLEVAGGTLRIEAVRGFGFRAEPHPVPSASRHEGRPMGAS